MNYSKQKFSIEEARQTDMVDYLSNLGYEPTKVSGKNYWYLSPLREEKTASFKVNRTLNRWYDHGLGRGGNIIDFAILWKNCTVGEFLHQLRDNLPFQQPLKKTFIKHADKSAERTIKILQVKHLSSFFLLRYLHLRRIPVDVAKVYCREILYEVNGKEYCGIGFKNISGGYEIRHPYFKGSSSPKNFTTLNNGAGEVSVFEGFTDFLSFIAIHKNQPQPIMDFVILNSVSFFEKARPFMEEHACIHLYLDRDATGQNCTNYALSLSPNYRDESPLYQHHKDLNDWLVNFGKPYKKNIE